MEPSRRQARVGPYPLELPSFWMELNVREKPPLFASSSIVTAGVSFDFNVLLGMGADQAEAARLEAHLLDAFAAERREPREELFHGLTYRGYRFEGVHKLGPRSIHEAYLVTAYDDLLHFGYTLSEPSDAEEALRHLFFTMIEGAIVERGYELMRSDHK